MLAVDIETIPLASSLAAPYNPADHAPPANYKTADAISGWHATNEGKWAAGRIKECSLSPRLGRVVSIQYADYTGVRSTIAKDGHEEAIALQEFWAEVRRAQQIVTWNGKGFDLPFLITRSAIHGVMPCVEVPLYQQRYNNIPHFDVKHALLGGDVRQKGEGLSEWLTAFGLPVKSGHGSEVHGMVQRGDWAALKAYGEGDVKGTYDLATRVAPFFGVR